MVDSPHLNLFPLIYNISEVRMKRKESSKVIAGRKGRENVYLAAPDTDSSTVHSTHSSEAAEVL